MKLPSLRATCGVLLALLATQCAGPNGRSTDLSPASWDPGELERLLAENADYGRPALAATGREAMVSGTTGAPAVRAGLEAMRQGGSAVDAVLTTALTQVALAGGAWVSYAGILTLVVYDAETGEVVSLDATYDIPGAERDARSIPAQGSGKPSGRTALVPGFFGGVEAAHARFGKLPFASLFDPAIHFAEEGLELPAMLAGMMERRRAVIERLPETRRALLKEDGRLYVAGELFRQPELAATLRAVAENGADYVYRGAWAERFVETVQREGGVVTLDDMASYAPTWSEPVRALYGEYEVCALGLPSNGGVNVVECLNLLEEAGLRSLGSPAEDAHALFWLQQATNLFALAYLPRVFRDNVVAEREGTLEERASRDWAAWLWKRMAAGEFALTYAPKHGGSGGHSDSVVAVDPAGNVAALVHTINTDTWGETGIFVDGISIPDSAAINQGLMHEAGPGARLPSPTNPLIVLRGGKPVLASGSIGAGLHQETVQNLLYVLDHGMAPKAAIDAPSLLLPAFTIGKPIAQTAAGEFDAEMLEEVRALGQPVKELSGVDQRSARGYWVAIWIDPETGELTGACPGNFNGAVLAD